VLHRENWFSENFRAAYCYSGLQGPEQHTVAVCCNVLHRERLGFQQMPQQHALAVYCSVLQCVASRELILIRLSFSAKQMCFAVYRSVSQCGAVRCSAMQCVTVCRSVLQHIAVHYIHGKPTCRDRSLSCSHSLSFSLSLSLSLALRHTLSISRAFSLSRALSLEYVRFLPSKRHKTTNALRHTVTHCNTMQHTATHCNTLQHTATHCNTLQRTATRCNTLQHTASHCITLQHVATHCARPNTTNAHMQIYVSSHIYASSPHSSSRAAW